MQRLALATAAAAFVLLGSTVRAEPPSAGEVGRFLGEATPVCTFKPAAACIDAGWRFADRNGDGQLGMDEADAVRDGVQSWFLNARDSLPKRTSAGIAVGLLALKVVGVESLLGSYDADGDGSLSREEALADVSLDGRPLPLILQDRAAVDWQRFLDRLGAGGLVAGDLIPKGDPADETANGAAE
jgi:hypothetical protein